MWKVLTAVKLPKNNLMFHEHGKCIIPLIFARKILVKSFVSANVGYIDLFIYLDINSLPK